MRGSGRSALLHWPGGNEENHENRSQDTRSAGHNLNPGPPLDHDSIPETDFYLYIRGFIQFFQEEVIGLVACNGSLRF